MAYFRSAGYEISDFTDAALEAARDSDDPETADDLEELDEQSGTEEADPQIVRDVDDDGSRKSCRAATPPPRSGAASASSTASARTKVDGMSRDDLVEHFTKEDDQ
jgi:hypothetical protein